MRSNTGSIRSRRSSPLGTGALWGPCGVRPRGPNREDLGVESRRSSRRNTGVSLHCGCRFWWVLLACLLHCFLYFGRCPVEVGMFDLGEAYLAYPIVKHPGPGTATTIHSQTCMTQPQIHQASNLQRARARRHKAMSLVLAVERLVAGLTACCAARPRIAEVAWVGVSSLASVRAGRRRSVWWTCPRKIHQAGDRPAMSPFVFVVCLMFYDVFGLRNLCRRLAYGGAPPHIYIYM